MAQRYQVEYGDINSRVVDTRTGGRGSRTVSRHSFYANAVQAAYLLNEKEKRTRRGGNHPRGRSAASRKDRQMVVQAVNNHALRKYEAFTSALETVRLALEESDPVIAAMSESGPARAQGWKVPTKKEVLAARKAATDLLDRLRGKAKQYEEQLIANGWRV